MPSIDVLETQHSLLAPQVPSPLYGSCECPQSQRFGVPRAVRTKALGSPCGQPQGEGGMGNQAAVGSCDQTLSASVTFLCIYLFFYIQN